MVVGESVAKQHGMGVFRMTLVVRKMKRTKAEQRTKWWKLKKEVLRDFQRGGTLRGLKRLQRSTGHSL